MRVRAKRLGWNERLTPEQEFDLDPYDRESNDLEGELQEYDVPAKGPMPAIHVTLVDGQEADPETVVHTEES